MARINLLPWREAERRKKNQKYLVQLLAAIMVVGGGVFAYQQVIESDIRHQRQRNAYLTHETELLQDSLDEIQKLERTKSHLLARMEIIHKLQRQRPQVVHLLYELASTVPDGVTLVSMEQSAQTITVKGLSDSNARVSTYMRQIDASDWFSNPVLEGITADDEGNRNTFSLRVQQAVPNPSADVQG